MNPVSKEEAKQLVLVAAMHKMIVTLDAMARGGVGRRVEMGETG